MNFLDFEQPIRELYERLEVLKGANSKENAPAQESIVLLEDQIKQRRREIYNRLTVWERIQVSRHPDRPYTLYYIETLCENLLSFLATGTLRMIRRLLGALGSIEGKTYMIIGHQKGVE